MPIAVTPCFRDPILGVHLHKPAVGPILAIALITLVSCTHGVGPGLGPGVVAESKPFPHLSGTTLDGTAFDTASLAGKPFVVNVWATWCAPCAREQPALVKLQAAYQGKVAFLGIDYENDTASAKAWVEQFGVHYPSLYDPSGKFAAVLAFPGAPDTYVVDAHGSLRYWVFGETSQQQLTGLLDSLLGSSSTTPGATPYEARTSGAIVSSCSAAIGGLLEASSSPAAWVHSARVGL